MATDPAQISNAVARVQAEVPKLAKLKIVFGGRADRREASPVPEESRRFRVEVPGPKVSVGPGDDERLQLSIPRAMFGILAEEGSARRLARGLPLPVTCRSRETRG